MAQAERKKRITKAEFHASGGFDNSDLFRKQTRGGSWRYYRCLHNYQSLGYTGLGCALYRCTQCDDEYEKDIT